MTLPIYEAGGYSVDLDLDRGYIVRDPRGRTLSLDTLATRLSGSGAPTPQGVGDAVGAYPFETDARAAADELAALDAEDPDAAAETMADTPRFHRYTLSVDQANAAENVLRDWLANVADGAEPEDQAERDHIGGVLAALANPNAATEAMPTPGPRGCRRQHPTPHPAGQ